MREAASEEGATAPAMAARGAAIEEGATVRVTAVVALARARVVATTVGASATETVVVATDLALEWVAAGWGAMAVALDPGVAEVAVVAVVEVVGTVAVVVREVVTRAVVMGGTKRGRQSSHFSTPGWRGCTAWAATAMAEVVAKADVALAVLEADRAAMAARVVGWVAVAEASTAARAARAEASSAAALTAAAAMA